MSFSNKTTPSLWRRFGAAVYETVLLFGVYFLGSYIVMTLTQTTYKEIATPGVTRWLMQIYLFLLFGIYFSFFWKKNGQTLAMKTWEIRLISADGKPIHWQQAVLRYLLVWPSLLFMGLGFFWALIDRDRQFLHDRLLGTRLIATGPTKG